MVSTSQPTAASIAAVISLQLKIGRQRLLDAHMGIQPALGDRAIVTRPVKTSRKTRAAAPAPGSARQA